MTCCRCNRTGRCQNCSCVKRGQPCLSCLPQRLRNCVNTVQTRSSALAAADILQPHPDEPNSTPPSTDASQQEPSPTTTDAHSSSPARNAYTATPETPLHPEDISPAPEIVATLPPFTPMADPVFVWGEHPSTNFTNSLNACYAEAVHWRPKVPYGKAGKMFTSQRKMNTWPTLLLF